MQYTNTVLIVDDQVSVHEVLKALLREEGYNLSFASYGEEALAKAAELKPDLILLDVMMPGMDGFEVCERLRTNRTLTETLIIMVTSLDDLAARIRGLEVGADDFVTKPFNGAELKARVRTITRLNRQRRLRALELQAERDRTQAILEALGEAVVVTDVAGIIQYLNPATALLTGFANEEALGQSWQLWENHETDEHLYNEILKVVRSGQTWRGEVVNRRKDGALYDAALTVAPLFAPTNSDEPIGFVSVQRDISPLKEAERSRSKFVSNVSHELRTPLSVITLLSDNLDRLYDRLDDTKRHKMIHDIQKHTQVLNELIGDVLEISRIDSGRISTEYDQVQLVPLVYEEVEKLFPLAQQKSQELKVSGSGPLTVRGNDNQLRQVVRNLLTNAIKYTPDEGQISCEYIILPSPRPEQTGDVNEIWPGGNDLPPGRWAAIRVADTGIGISQVDLPHLFERFYRVKAQGNIRGTGLGLSITRELIELHSGHIVVSSTLDKGSIFAIYLPLLTEE